MTAMLRGGTLVGLLVFSVACDAQRPTLPSSFYSSTAPTPPITPPTPPARPPAPPVSGPSTSYSFSGPLEFPVHDVTTTSRYVLYDSGAFLLRYERPGGGEYLGSYRQEAERIIFDFGADGDQRDGQPAAIGTLNGDVLEVRYSRMMQESSFEDAAYRRSQ